MELISHRSLLVQLVWFCALSAVLLMEGGCVSQRAYEQVRAETQTLTHTLQTVRDEVAILNQSLSSLESANREEEHALDELRVAVQREAELLPILRRQAFESMASLQAQIATLTGQSRILARQIAAAKRES
ncbi:MAG: hypothetical protein NZM29_06215, partial [Nitrospira sp.]|nr:hypothetical protein [Nitrospira sp.]